MSHIGSGHRGSSPPPSPAAEPASRPAREPQSPARPARSALPRLETSHPIERTASTQSAPELGGEAAQRPAPAYQGPIRTVASAIGSTPQNTSSYQRVLHDIADRPSEHAVEARKLLALTRHPEGLKIFFYQRDNGALIAMSHSPADADAYQQARHSGKAHATPPEHVQLARAISTALAKQVWPTGAQSQTPEPSAITALRTEALADLVAPKDRQALKQDAMMKGTLGNGQTQVDASTGLSHKGGHNGGFRLTYDEATHSYQLSESVKYRYDGATPENIALMARFYANVLRADTSHDPKTLAVTAHANTGGPEQLSRLQTVAQHIATLLAG